MFIEIIVLWIKYSWRIWFSLNINFNNLCNNRTHIKVIINSIFSLEGYL